MVDKVEKGSATPSKLSSILEQKKLEATSEGNNSSDEMNRATEAKLVPVEVRKV